MDRAAELLEALEARAEEKSLEELGRRGKSRVKVIRPSEIAGMIQEAVQRALAGSDYVPPERVAALVEEGRSEFQQLLARREAELEESARQLRALEESRSRLAESEASRSALQAELEASRGRIEELESTLEQARAERPEPGRDAPVGSSEPGGVGAELLLKLMGEVMELKGKVAAGALPQTSEATPGGGLAEKLEKIVGALDSKLERLGRKVGASDAVEGGGLAFDALFAHQDQDLENNLDTVKVQERSGAGIGASLERMKKLRQKGK